MPTLSLDRVKLPPNRVLHVRGRLWREWCFLRAAFKHYRFRLLVFLIIILATNDDLANLEIGLDARRLAPDIRVVVRMFDQNLADKIRDGLNIHIAMSQSAISAPAFATAAIDPSIISSLVVGDQLVVIKRWRVRDDGPLNGKTVADILVDVGCSVIQHRPKDRPGRLFPPPATRLTTGDEILVQGPFDALVSLKRESANLT